MTNRTEHGRFKAYCLPRITGSMTKVVVIIIASIRPIVTTEIVPKIFDWIEFR